MYVFSHSFRPFSVARNGCAASEPWGFVAAPCCFCPGVFHRQEQGRKELWESDGHCGKHVQTPTQTGCPDQAHENRVWLEDNGRVVSCTVLASTAGYDSELRLTDLMALMLVLPSVCPSFSSVLQFIMWMLREGRGMVETMLKINHFFPNKLPQYQGQCVSVQHKHSDCFYNFKKCWYSVLKVQLEKLLLYMIHTTIYDVLLFIGPTWHVPDE